MNNINSLNSVEIVVRINILLAEHNRRKDYIRDKDDPDYYIRKIEYHKAQSYTGKPYGDESDNFYADYKEAEC